MQDYIIKSFRSRQGAILERQETGPNSGGYVSENGLIIKRLNDFLCDGEYSIHSVLRCERVERQNPVGTIFTVGDRVVGTNGNIISSIRIERSDVVLMLSGGQTNASVRLANAQKYVEVAQRTQTVKRNVGRPKTNHFAAIEESIARSYTRPIRLEKTLKKSVARLNLEQFVIRFLTEWNNERATIYADDRTVQTPIKRRRSLGDIYMICKYYYPNVTVDEVARLLYVTLHTTLRGRGFRTSRCNQILKRVWYVSPGISDSIHNQDIDDEYGHNWNWWITRLG